MDLGPGPAASASSGVRNANSQMPLQTHQIRKSGVGAQFMLMPAPVSVSLPEGISPNSLTGLLSLSFFLKEGVDYFIIKLFIFL